MEPSLTPEYMLAPGVFELSAGIVSLVVLALLWSLVWKALALWKSARRGSKVWFIVFLVVNTVGILEILYLYVFSREKVQSAPAAKTDALAQ